MATSAEALCKYNAPEFCKFTEAVLEMRFDEEPKYAALISLFEPILAGCVHKPICVDSAIKVKPARRHCSIHSCVAFAYSALHMLSCCQGRTYHKALLSGLVVRRKFISIYYQQLLAIKTRSAVTRPIFRAKFQGVMLKTCPPGKLRLVSHTWQCMLERATITILVTSIVSNDNSH